MITFSIILTLGILLIIFFIYKIQKKELLEEYDLGKLNGYHKDTFIRLIGVNRDISLDYLRGIQYEVLYSEEHKNYVIGIRHIKVPKKLYYVFLIKDYSRNGDKRFNLKVKDSLDNLSYYLDKIKTLDNVYNDIEDIKIMIKGAIDLEIREINRLEDYKNKVLDKKYKTVDIIYPDKE